MVVGLIVVLLVALVVWATCVALIGEFILLPLFGDAVSSTIRLILSAVGGGLLAQGVLVKMEELW